MSIEHYLHPAASRTNIPHASVAGALDPERKAGGVYQPKTRITGEVRLAWDRGRDGALRTFHAAPLYINEQIHPGEIARRLSEEDVQRTLDLSADHNGIPFGRRYDWYRYHGKNWSNRMIRGEARKVLASLLELEHMGGRVQCLYMDPPYGMNFKAIMQASAASRAQGDAVRDVPCDPVQIKAFQDSYANHIHSYLDTILETAALGRDLLSDAGSFFLQIGKANVHRLAVLLDEIFGAQNRVATIVFRKSGTSAASGLPEIGDFLLWYAKDRQAMRDAGLPNRAFQPLTRREKRDYMNWDVMVEEADGTERKLTSEEAADMSRDLKTLPEGARLFRRVDLQGQGELESRSFEYPWNGRRFQCRQGRHWSIDEDALDQLAKLNRLASTGEGGLTWKRYEGELAGSQINNLWADTATATDLHYVVETSEEVVRRCILMSTQGNRI